MILYHRIKLLLLKAGFIAESIVVAHEIIHSAANNNKPGFVFKLDYEKAYDRIYKESI